MNKHWVFYDQYGWIIKNMDCPDEMAQDNVKEGESLLIQKLYEALSLELNKQKGSQRHERDL